MEEQLLQALFGVIMGAAKFMVLFLFVNVLSFRTRADTAPIEDDVIAPDVDQSSLKIELDRLKSKISFLESSIDEKIHELKSKDESTKQMEKLIQEKSDRIASLHGEIESLQTKGSSNSEEQVVKAHARAGELEKQVVKLKEEIGAQSKKKEALETRANIAEKKIQELTLKLESVSFGPSTKFSTSRSEFRTSDFAFKIQYKDHVILTKDT